MKCSDFRTLTSGGDSGILQVQSETETFRNQDIVNAPYTLRRSRKDLRLVSGAFRS
jgi:hypothetical protein